MCRAGRRSRDDVERRSSRSQAWIKRFQRLRFWWINRIRFVGRLERILGFTRLFTTGCLCRVVGFPWVKWITRFEGLSPLTWMIGNLKLIVIECLLDRGAPDDLLSVGLNKSSGAWSVLIQV